ncbi:protein Smaug homolog 1 [Trichonephila inaurata madagascariensis]|uniref:Protein Smaug homolog 1 n=1 Tax=Trichonephila inaurata madagascariensis TaxID=2747483 RepID=A0A8X7CMC3_9ARAC|nr:protein Smaug homolog 1 [Trichonephila inaurata madagascariensis]
MSVELLLCAVGESATPIRSLERFLREKDLIGAFCEVQISRHPIGWSSSALPLVVDSGPRRNGKRIRISARAGAAASHLAMQLLPGLALNTYLANTRGGTMKSSHHFRDQLSVMTGWFDQWNNCEQTVALYSLFKRIEPGQARFLAQVLEQNIAHCVELQMQEQQANDPAYISNLSTESKEMAVIRLLSHLPLLRPGNEEAKSRYLELIPKILAHSIRHDVHIEESRQLLSYSLIHPAISNDDRCSLTQWLRQLEDRIHNNDIYPATLEERVPNCTVYPPNGIVPSDGYNQFVPRMDLWRPGSLVGVETNSYSLLNSLGSNSLPPCVGSQHVALHGMNSAPSSGVSSHPDGTQTLPMPHSRLKRSCSLTPPGQSLSHLNGSSTLEPHAPLSPQSSVTSSGSGSESQKDERDAFNQDGTGMKDVPCWLKGLRLHKYAYIFKNMSYEEMMSVTEEKLEKMNITKGARHKIVLSIQKLRERQPNLRSLEKDIQDGEGTVRCALNEIKSMLQTPIKSFSYLNYSRDPSNGGESESSCSDPPSAPPSPPLHDSHISEGDLPGQLTRLLGKICSSLLISPNQDEDLNFFVMIVDKCLSHEAFTPAQKRRLFSWKQQVQKACHPLPPRRSLDNRQRNKWSSYHNGNGEQDSVCGSLRRRLPVQYQPQRLIPPNYPAAQRSPLSAVIKRPSLQEHMKPHVQVQRTNSAPVRPNPLPASLFGKASEGGDSNDPELNIRLETLCLSVTEHALGSFDGAVPLF